MISQARLKELVSYDQETGEMRRLLAASNSPAGSLLTCPDSNGYLRGRIDGKRYYVHRLAWLYMTGEWPSCDVDHRDGATDNNRWVNLRGATRSQNLENTAGASMAKSGVKNVYFCKRSEKWLVKIMHNYKSKSFGYFHDIEDAKLAATAAKREIHKFQPEFAR